MTSKLIVSREPIEIPVEAENPEHANQRAQADRQVTVFELVDHHAGDAGSFRHLGGGHSPSFARQAQSSAERARSSLMSRERGDRNLHYVS